MSFEGQSHNVHTTTIFGEKGEPKRNQTKIVLSNYQHNALPARPNRLTFSLLGVAREYFSQPAFECMQYGLLPEMFNSLYNLLLQCSYRRLRMHSLAFNIYADASIDSRAVVWTHTNAAHLVSTVGDGL